MGHVGTGGGHRVGKVRQIGEVGEVGEGEQEVREGTGGSGGAGAGAGAHPGQGAPLEGRPRCQSTRAEDFSRHYRA